MNWMKGFFNKWAIYFVLAAFLCGLTGGGYLMHVWQEYQAGKALKNQVEERLKKESQYQEKAMALETELERQRAANRSITQRLNHELQSNPVYRSCVVPADGVRLLREAITGPEAPSEHDGKMPVFGRPR